MLLESLSLRENKFYVEGEGNIKYTYSNGHLANDPKLAVSYFINALEKIPTLIERYEKKNAELSKDLPVLQEVKNTAWRKESELKDLKTELAGLERKIEFSLKPIEQSEDKLEKVQQSKQTQNENPNSYLIPEGLKEYQNTMGDRIVIADIPKYSEQPIKIKIKA